MCSASMYIYIYIFAGRSMSRYLLILRCLRLKVHNVQYNIKMSLKSIQYFRFYVTLNILKNRHIFKIQEF